MAAANEPQRIVPTTRKTLTFVRIDAITFRRIWDAFNELPGDVDPRIGDIKYSRVTGPEIFEGDIVKNFDLTKWIGDGYTNSIRIYSFANHLSLSYDEVDIKTKMVALHILDILRNSRKSYQGIWILLLTFFLLLLIFYAVSLILDTAIILLRENPNREFSLWEFFSSPFGYMLAFGCTPVASMFIGGILGLRGAHIDMRLPVAGFWSRRKEEIAMLIVSNFVGILMGFIASRILD